MGCAQKGRRQEMSALPGEAEMNENQPAVCCIMLTRDRPEMAARALRSWQDQTYIRKRLFVLDTSDLPFAFPPMSGTYWHQHQIDLRSLTIGALRNYANRYAGPDCL